MWLVTNAAAGSPDRAEHAILEVILATHVFDQSRSFLWSGNHFVVYETPLEL